MAIAQCVANMPLILQCSIEPNEAEKSKQTQEATRSYNIMGHALKVGMEMLTQI